MSPGQAVGLKYSKAITQGHQDNEVAFLLSEDPVASFL